MKVRSRYLTAAEAARFLGLKPRRFRDLRARYPLPCYRFGGERAHPRFRRDELEAWAERFLHEPSSSQQAPPRRRQRRGRRSWATIIRHIALDNSPSDVTLSNGVLRPDEKGE